MIGLAVVGVMVILDPWLLLFAALVSFLTAGLFAIVQQKFRKKRRFYVFICAFLISFVLFSIFEQFCNNLMVVKFDVISSLQGAVF